MPDQDDVDDAAETENDDAKTEVAEETEDDVDPEGAEQLGDAGKKALDAMKARMREERSKRRAAEAQIAELTKPKPASKLEEDGKTEDAPDADAIRREVEAELKAELEAAQQRERVLDKIEVRAAKTFEDPADAPLMLLREHKIEDFLDDDGKPDLEAIQDALRELLEKKPYLAAAQGGKRFQGSGDGGAKPSKPARPKSLDEAVKVRLSK